MSVIRIELPDLSATQRFGELLSDHLKAGDVIALSGALGAGKSALARAIIQTIDPTEVDVPSPTFTLVQHYTLADGTPLWHLDLYRIDDAQDAMALGLDDAFVDAVCVIEWPDRLKKFLPKTNLSIHLYADETAEESDDSASNTADDAELGSSVRFADVTAPPHWADRITGLVEAISAGADT
jgi:tRNA threonylcarbamoyladenosine biosynthesis protein TsaE